MCSTSRPTDRPTNQPLQTNKANKQKQPTKLSLSKTYSKISGSFPRFFVCFFLRGFLKHICQLFQGWFLKMLFTIPLVSANLSGSLGEHWAGFDLRSELAQMLLASRTISLGFGNEPMPFEAATSLGFGVVQHANGAKVGASSVCCRGSSQKTWRHLLEPGR